MRSVQYRLQLSHNTTDWWRAHIFKTTWTWIMDRKGEFALFFTITIIASFVFRFLWVNRSIDMQFILSNIVCLFYWLIELKILSIEPYMSLHISLLRVLNGFFTHIINHSPGPCKVIPGENCFIYSSNRVLQVFVTVARWTRGSPDVVCVNFTWTKCPKWDESSKLPWTKIVQKSKYDKTKLRYL